VTGRAGCDRALARDPVGTWQPQSRPPLHKGRARLIRKTRTGLGLSQAEFATRFRVPVGTLRDWEQARATAPDFAIAYVRIISLHPEIVAKAV